MCFPVAKKGKAQIFFLANLACYISVKESGGDNECIVLQYIYFNNIELSINLIDSPKFCSVQKRYL